MSILFSGSLAQRLRLASGLILFMFALTHFLNHALGLVGVDAMEAAQAWRLMVTRSLPGSAILVLALFTHVSLALGRIARRTTLVMPVWEALQIATGLLIPVLLIPHVVGTRFGATLFGIDTDYAYVLLNIWPDRAIAQSTLLLLVWVHGCIGLHFWLRLADGYRSWQPVLLALAVAVPLLGLSGFVTAGREVADSLRETFEATRAHEQVAAPSAEVLATLKAIATAMVEIFIGLVTLAFGLVAARRLIAFLAQSFVVTYFAGPKVRSAPGPTLLEISRRKGIPHVSVCGGRGRCSTCRVHIDQGSDTLGIPNPVERRTLDRIGAGAGVRLACQIRPGSDLGVTRLVKPGARRLLSALTASAETHGVERTLTIMFLDIRSFTKLTQTRLPYDIVFILNRLFDHFGDAIRKEGGRIEKYLGDGLMAVFGRESGPAVGARQALAAARAIDLTLDAANAEIAAVVGQAVDIGIGLHAGPVVIGEIGHSSGMAIDIIGETVNTAARLEALTKDEHCQIIASTDVLQLAGADLAALPRKIVHVRGIDAPLVIVAIPAGREIDLTGEKHGNPR
ncbi:MAG: adenylate/guanylate cyclase domain-containing protein [Hyphomicrobiaceae bacterium]